MLDTDLLTEITDETFASTVLANPLPVLVDVWAEWCPPCHALSRSLVELAPEFEGRLVMTTLDADANPETVRAHRIQSLPTLLIYRGGELVSATVGSRPTSRLRALLSEYCA